MDTITSDKILEKFMLLMEEKRLYLIKELSSQKVAQVLNISKGNLESLLHESQGVNIELAISMYRIQHARELLIIGVSYSDLWQFSGFLSQSNMERAFEDVVF